MTRSILVSAMSNSGDEVSEALNKTLSKQLAERTSTAQEFFDIKVIELSDNPNTPGNFIVHVWKRFSMDIARLYSLLAIPESSFGAYLRIEDYYIECL